MRESLFFLMLFLVGCGGNGVESVIVPDTGQPPAQPAAQHAPEITDVVFMPGTVNHMEGDGSVVVMTRSEGGPCGNQVDLADADAEEDNHSLFLFEHLRCNEINREKHADEERGQAPFQRVVRRILRVVEPRQVVVDKGGSL